MLPAWDARFLPDDQASFSRDTYLYSGAVVGWRKPKILHVLNNSAAKFAYRVPVISQGIAQANLVYIGNPNPGDQVTIGEITYTYQSTPLVVNDILRGSTTTLSMFSLFLAANFGAIDPAIMGPNTTANPAVAAQAPVLGFPTSFTSATNTPGANMIILVPVVPTGTMSLTALNLMPAGTNGTAKFRGVVYDNINQINATGTAYVDIPSSLVATGNEVVGCTSGTAIVSTLPTATTLIAGTKYWLGFIMDSAVSLTLFSGSTVAVSNSNPYTSGPPNPFQTTSLSGVTTGGTNVGSLQTNYNTSQPNWQLWGSMSTLASTDAVNTYGTNVIGGPSYTYAQYQAPAFGASYNKTPVSETTGAARMTWLFDFNSFADVTTTYRGGSNQSADTTITGTSTWLEFLDQDTNVLRTPVVDDVFQRFYFASPSLPPQYNTYARIAAGLPPWYLGVPAPLMAPTLTVSGGGNPTQIGFPGSSTSNTYTITDVLGNNASLRLVLYPMTSTEQVTLASIAVQVAADPSKSLVMTGVIFADTTATNPNATSAPGDFIAQGSGFTASIQALSAAPYTATDIFPTATPVILNANTQYWIGVAFLQGTGIQIQKSDTKTQGFTAYNAPGQYPRVWGPTDPTTGAAQAPPMTSGFADLQLWGNLTSIGTGAQLEARAYVYTWVTAYGEEGPPSPPALFDNYDNATWQVGVPVPLSQDLGVVRNIVKTNIYRTMASQQGGTVFFFVGSIGATATTFVDNVTDQVVALNQILPSTTWFGPPATLQGIVAMPNGMMAGFRGNEVWFCEPFRPHAWPSGYVMTTDYPIVGLGVSGITLVACTQTNPQTFTGPNPATMSQVRISLPEPCIARGGILGTENGVYYPSINGLIKVQGGGSAANITQSWITREKWDALVPQKFMRAAKNVSTYFAYGTTGVTNGQADNTLSQRGFTLELSEIADRESFTLWPQVGGHRLGFNSLSSHLGSNIDNVLVDPWSGTTMLVSASGVYYYDFTDLSPTIVPYLWRSKKFQGPHKENFAAFRVWFDIPPGGPQTPPAVRTTLAGTTNPPISAQLAFAPGMFGVIRIIADGLYITERELRYSTELMRVASQQKYTTWQVEVEGIVSVTSIKMATTVKELAKIEMTKGRQP
jgi:hypothetical protein